VTFTLIDMLYCAVISGSLGAGAMACVAFGRDEKVWPDDGLTHEQRVNELAQREEHF
jgi:hypothetical protein